jgi:AcrR family transcriptional regulator
MTVRTGHRARKQPAEVRRETVLDAAMRVFARTPYRAAGTAEIAREAGVAEPTIYRYFDSKRELFLATLERCSEEIISTFRDIAARTDDVGEALHRMGEWYRERIIADPIPLRLRQRAAAEADDPEVVAVLSKINRDVVALVTELLRRGQAQGTVSRAITPEGGALLFLAVGLLLDHARLTGLSVEETVAACDQVSEACKQALLVRPT